MSSLIGSLLRPGSEGLPGSRARAEESTDIIVTILMLAERAAGHGTVPGPRCCMGFGMFRANFGTYSLLIADLGVYYAVMEVFVLSTTYYEFK